MFCLISDKEISTRKCVSYCKFWSRIFNRYGFLNCAGNRDKVIFIWHNNCKKNLILYLSAGQKSCDKLFELHRDKTSKMAYAPSEDSDQPWHPPSLIRVFAVRMKKLGSLATHWVHSEDSDQTELMPHLSLRWAHSHFVGFVMRWLVWAMLWKNLSLETCDQVRLELAYLAAKTS